MMSEEDKWKTCFISHRGSYHFVRMPMGLRNAPATFQRSINEVLGELKWRICAVFFDDLLGHSRTFEKHLIDLPQILSMTIHPKKFNCAVENSNYLVSSPTMDRLGLTQIKSLN